MIRPTFAILAVVLAVSASRAATVPIPDGGYAVALAPGEETDFNQLHLQCGRDRAAVTFGEDKAADRMGEGFGRGALETAFADCRLADGTIVRVKAGYGDPPMATGMCGGDPEKILSIWIGRRKVVSRKTFAAMCSEILLKSVEIDSAGATVCTLGLDDNPGRRDFAELPPKGSCEGAPVAAGTADAIEFAADTPPPGTLTPRGRNPALCRAMAVPGRYPRAAVPARFARPGWTPVPPHASPIDEAKLGFNATNFARFGTREARFDLENTGRVRTVYQHDQDDHWFAGSALAIARPGILDVPFDAHDRERSWKSGIYAFVYDRVTVFFDGGRTHLLLDPANPLNDPRVVTLRGGVETEICRLERQQENF